MIQRIGWVVVGAAVLGTVGCGAKRPYRTSEQFVNPVTERRVSDQNLVAQDVDLDADGETDISNYYRERSDAPRLLVRKELDLNRDGKIDVVSFLNAEGDLEREEMDSDYDGQFDWTDHYQKGVRVMSEYDTDADGRPNVFKYYIRGDDGTMRLDRKERDEDGDGKTDVWERFSASGEVIRTGRDTDGDGKVDVREE
jgi:hypothetical protein